MTRTENHRKVLLVVTALLALSSLIATPFWADFWRAISTYDLDYAQKRVQFAFGGFPVDQFSQRLDTLLPRETAVSFGPSLLKNDFLMQRLTEGLYPRIIDKTSPYALEISENSAQKTGTALALLPLDQSHSVFLINNGGNPPASFSSAQAVESTEFSLALFLLGVFAAFGLGAPLARFQARLSNLLSGAVVIGLLSSLSTWLQIPLPRNAIAVIGALIAMACLAQAMAKKQFPQLPRTPETYGFALLLFLFFIQVLLFPVTLWDGRSIWFFHTKQIFFHGMFANQDLLHPDSIWSHPMYPLLLPGWLNSFNLFSPLYNERMSALGLPVLFSAGLALIWALARQSLGRWPGAAFTAAIFFSLNHHIAGGYADGFVLIFLLIEFLVFRDSQQEWIGWTAALAASLVKQEGFLMAGMIAAAFITLERPRRLSQFAKLAVFIPALIHETWVKWLGLKGVFSDIRWSEVIEDFFSRLATIFESIPELLGHYPLLWQGTAALIPALVCAAYFRKSSRPGAKPAILLGLAFFFLFTTIMLVTPLDLRWHVYTAFDRLMLYPAAFSVLSLLFFLC